MTLSRSKYVKTTLQFSLALAVMAALTAPAWAATNFTEDFSDNSATPNMALRTAFGSPVTDFTGDFSISGAPDSNRVYLGTNDTDYSTIDFTFEATVTMSGADNPWAGAFMGMGSPNASAGNNGEPSNPKVAVQLLPLSPPGGSADQIQSRDLNVSFTHDSSSNIQTGTHRLRMTWDATTQMATFDVDKNYTGTFGSDVSFTLDGSNNGFTSSNSALFIGGGSGNAAAELTIDDISVVPEPSSMLLLLAGTAMLVGCRSRHRSW